MLCSQPRCPVLVAGGGRSRATAASSQTSSMALSSAWCSVSPVTGWVSRAVWHCFLPGAGWTSPWHSYPRSKPSASPAGATDTGRGGHQAGLYPIGVYHGGDIPGPVIAHPWQGRPRQTPLCHLPECASQAGSLWGQLLLPGLAGLHRGVHPTVRSSCQLGLPAWPAALGLPEVQEQAFLGPGRVHGSGELEAKDADQLTGFRVLVILG